MGKVSHTPAGAMSLSEEITMLRKRVKEQDKEIRCLKEENEFLEEASAFFVASRWKPAKLYKKKDFEVCRADTCGFFWKFDGMGRFLQSGNKLGILELEKRDEVCMIDKTTLVSL